ncbi:TKL/TKL-ccin protein kinase [Mycena venus]|uniref:TKL/TKL-ccin protein kinase n=1 Tax=Mycena venus TaxID=2733690 RepID=A0A8H6XSC3_9AGAR|nr:TKL/TKL-ccin protein kinase [Mycena venus]
MRRNFSLFFQLLCFMIPFPPSYQRATNKMKNESLALRRSPSQAISPSSTWDWEARRDTCPTPHSSHLGFLKHAYQNHYPDDPHDRHLHRAEISRLSVPFNGRVQFLMQMGRGTSPAVSEGGYSTMSTTSQLSIYNGGPETAPASEDEGSFTNAYHRSLSWIFPVQKLRLAPELPHREEYGREISFEDCNGQIYPHLLVEIDRWRTLEGGNATTRMGNLIVSDNQPILVAFKVIKLNPDVASLKYCERLNREVHVWHGLRHPNILPFLGVYDIGHDVPVLISPYYKFGHIGRYLQSHPWVDRNKLVRDVASGLKYLHDRKVVHGDLKAENILVDQHGDACICDFGISRISNIKGFTTSNRAGTMVYMAPELFEEHGAASELPAPRTTFESDTWAFGLVALGVYFNHIPSPHGQGAGRTTLRHPTIESVSGEPPSSLSETIRFCSSRDVESAGKVLEF